MIYTVDGSVEGTEYGKLGVVDNFITYHWGYTPTWVTNTD